MRVNGLTVAVIIASLVGVSGQAMADAGVKEKPQATHHHAKAHLRQRKVKARSHRVVQRAALHHAHAYTSIVNERQPQPQYVPGRAVGFQDAPDFANNKIMSLDLAGVRLRMSPSEAEAALREHGYFIQDRRYGGCNFQMALDNEIARRNANLNKVNCVSQNIIQIEASQMSGEKVSVYFGPDSKAAGGIGVVGVDWSATKGMTRHAVTTGLVEKYGQPNAMGAPGGSPTAEWTYGKVGSGVQPRFYYLENVSGGDISFLVRLDGQAALTRQLAKDVNDVADRSQMQNLKPHF